MKLSCPVCKGAMEVKPTRSPGKGWCVCYRCGTRVFLYFYALEAHRREHERLSSVAGEPQADQPTPKG
jgi:hypothetical protein